MLDPRQNSDIDWPAMFSEWQESGLTKKAFCNRKEISVGSFYAAIQRQRQKERKVPRGFIQARMRRPTREIVDGCTVEFGGGVKVRLKELDLKLIKALVEFTR